MYHNRIEAHSFDEQVHSMDFCSLKNVSVFNAIHNTTKSWKNADFCKLNLSDHRPKLFSPPQVRLEFFFAKSLILLIY